MSNPDITEKLKVISNSLAVLEGDAHAVVEDMVSVCIPHRNRAGFLGCCIESILKQTYRPLEIVIVDDCSDDDSWDEIMSWSLAAKEAGVTLLAHRLPRRGGTAWAQNVAYYLARGEFLANQDSDDASHPLRIDAQVRALKSHGWDALGTGYFLMHDHPGDDFTNPSIWIRDNPATIAREYQANRHRVCWGTVLMKASVIQTLGGKNKLYVGAEDFEILKRMVTSGFVVGNLNSQLYYYRQHAGQRSKIFHG